MLRYHSQKFLELFRYTFVLLQVDIHSKYKASVIGIYWLVINPVVTIFIYFLIFSQLIQIKVPGIGVKNSYFLYLITGIIPWMAFSSILSRSANLLLEKKAFITKINFPLLTIIASSILFESFIFFVAYIPMSIYFLYEKLSTLSGIIMYLFIFILQQIFAMFIAIILSFLSVFLRDIKEVLPFLVQILFWITPIAYNEDILPHILKFINPVYYFTNSYHEVLLFSGYIPLRNLFIMLLCVSISGFVAFYIYRKLSKIVREYI